MILPKNSKDVKALRECLTSLKNQMCSAAGSFSDPLKKVFTEVSSKFDAVLAALPKDDQPGDWSLESQLEGLFGLLTCASAAASQASLELTKLRDEKESIAAQYASKLSADITAKIASGELFSKEAHAAALAKATEGFVPQTQVTQLCSASHAKGLTDGETKVRGEIAAQETRKTVIATRKAGLQKASLPIPDAEFEAILGGSDAEFEAAKALFESRNEALRKEGYQLAGFPDLLGNLWLPEAPYNAFKKTIAGIPALKIVAEPLASPGGGTGKTPGPMIC